MTSVIKGKTINKKLANHILQKATKQRASVVKDMLENPNIQYKCIVIITIKDKKIQIEDSKLVKK